MKVRSSARRETPLESTEELPLDPDHAHFKVNSGHVDKMKGLDIRLTDGAPRWRMVRGCLFTKARGMVKRHDKGKAVLSSSVTFNQQRFFKLFRMRIPATRRSISPVWSGLYDLVLIALVCYTTAAPSGLGSRSESIHLASASNPYAHLDEDSNGWRQIVRLATVNPLGEELPHSPGYAYADVDNWTTEEPGVSLPDYHSSGTYIDTQHPPPSESFGPHSHHQQHITNPWAMEGGQGLEEIVKLATVNHSEEELPRTPEYTYPDVDSWTEYDSQAESGHDSSLLYGRPSSASKIKPAQEPSSSATEASQLLYQPKRTPKDYAMEGWQSPTRLRPSQKQVEQGTSQSDVPQYDATSLGHYSDRQLRNLVKWGKPNVGRPPLLISDDERRARKSKQDCEARIRRRERMREGYEERLRKEDEERLRLRTAAGQRQLAAYLNSYKRGRW